MPSSVDLVVKLMADTTQANASFTSFGKNLGVILGVGAAGAAGAVALQTSADFQTSMSRIQQAYNSVDFAPGTQNYTTAVDKVVQFSTTMATNFEDVAASMAQAAKVTDEYGNKLPLDKMNEFVDANLRLKASSQDSIDAITSGQNMAMFDKMFTSQDYKGTGSAIAALTTQHPQSEETLWQAALGIGRIGAPLGVTMAQALGVGNYLSDVGGGGQTGGASIGRMLLRMDTSADAVLDPETKYSNVKKARDAQERLDDLQTSLREADARQAGMYGQHGLKTQYKKNPAEVMAAEDRRAKLQREIADQQEDIAHLNDPNRSRPRGQMNIEEMAKTAGQTANEFAELFKATPMEALLDFTGGLHALPATERGAAMTKAGIVNVRDQQTVSLLSDQPESVRRMIGIAQGEFVNPTALNEISNVGLNTANAHLANLHETMRDSIATGGQGALGVADKGITDMTALIQGGHWDELQKKIVDTASHFDQINSVLAPFAPVLEGIGLALGAKSASMIGSMLAGSRGATTAVEVAAQSGVRGAMLAGGGVAAMAGGIGFLQINELMEEFKLYNKARTAAGLQPVQINIGDVVSQGGSPDEMLGHVIDALKVAWGTAMTTTPVSGTVGGNIGGQAP